MANVIKDCERGAPVSAKNVAYAVLRTLAMSTPEQRSEHIMRKWSGTFEALAEHEARSPGLSGGDAVADADEG